MTIKESLLLDQEDGIFADWAASSARTVFCRLPEKWSRLLPEFDVVPTTMSFRDIDGLVEGAGDQGVCEQDLAGVFVCRLSSVDGSFRLFIGGSEYSGQDELESCLLYELGLIMWDHCPTLRNEVLKLAKDPQIDITDDDCRIAFAETLPSYVFAPRTLRAREEYLYVLMDMLNKKIESGEICREEMSAVSAA